MFNFHSVKHSPNCSSSSSSSLESSLVFRDNRSVRASLHCVVEGDRFAAVVVTGVRILRSWVDDSIATDMSGQVKSRVMTTFLVGSVRAFPQVHNTLAALKDGVVERSSVAAFVILLVHALRPKSNGIVAAHIVLAVEMTACFIKGSSILLWKWVWDTGTRRVGRNFFTNPSSASNPRISVRTQTFETSVLIGAGLIATSVSSLAFVDVSAPPCITFHQVTTGTFLHRASLLFASLNLLFAMSNGQCSQDDEAEQSHH
jgi:hypothetical protein